MKRTRWRRVLPRWACSYLAIFVWEILSTPHMSHSDSWRGVWVSVLAVPIASFWIGRGGATTGSLFIFGFGSALLFVPRFLSMDRFPLWLQHNPAAPGDIALLCMWVAFMFVMGGVGVRVLDHLARSGGGDQDRRPPIRSEGRAWYRFAEKVYEWPWVIRSVTGDL